MYQVIAPLVASLKFKKECNVCALRPAGSTPRSIGTRRKWQSLSKMKRTGHPNVKKAKETPVQVLLPSSAQADMILHTLDGSIRISACSTGNLLFNIPKHLSIVDRVRLWDALYRRSAAVCGRRNGVIKDLVQAYPLSPRRKPSSILLSSSERTSPMLLCLYMNESCVAPGHLATMLVSIPAKSQKHFFNFEFSFTWWHFKGWVAPLSVGTQLGITILMPDIGNMFFNCEWVVGMLFSHW